MTATPRTDAMEAQLAKTDFCFLMEPEFPTLIEFARELERELAGEVAQRHRSAQADTDAARAVLKAMGGDPGYSLLDNARRLREQLNGLRHQASDIALSIDLSPAFVPDDVPSTAACVSRLIAKAIRESV